MPDDIKDISRPTTHAQPRGFKSKYPWIVGGLVLTIVALVAILVFKPIHSDGQPYRYIYQNLDNYQLLGPKAGNGASFQKPVEFVPQGSLAAIRDQAIFVHNIDNKQKIYAGNEAISAVPVDPAPTASYLQNLNQAILDPKVTGHQQIVAPLNQFVKDRLNSRYVISFAQPRALITPTIKANAWTIDFDATDKAPKSKTAPTHLKGQAVLAVGKSTYYYFMVTAIDYNWQSNSKVWQQVTNSIKIDQ